MNEADEAHLQALADLRLTSPPSEFQSMRLLARAVLELREAITALKNEVRLDDH